MFPTKEKRFETGILIAAWMVKEHHVNSSGNASGSRLTAQRWLAIHRDGTVNSKRKQGYSRSGILKIMLAINYYQDYQDRTGEKKK
jgi:hypothetical protein